MFYLGLKNKDGKLGVIDVFDFASVHEAYVAYANRIHASAVLGNFPDSDSRNVFIRSLFDCDVIELVSVDDVVCPQLVMSVRDFVDKYSILLFDNAIKETNDKVFKEVE